MPEIISREEARAMGMKRYFTGLHCPHGHLCERWICDRGCAECQKIKTRRIHAERRARDPDWSRRVNAENYAKHREVRKIKMKEDNALFTCSLRALQELGIGIAVKEPSTTKHAKAKRKYRERMMADPIRAEVLRARDREKSMAYYWRNPEKCKKRHRERSKKASVARRALKEIGIQI